MQDAEKSKEQLLQKLADYRQRLARLEYAVKANQPNDEDFQDTAEQKKAEATLQANKERQRAFALIGLALSIEKDINKLLEMIVDEARKLSHADAGTLYIVDNENSQLQFEILQNDTMQTRIGGTSGVPINLPAVPLYVDDRPNHSNVSSYVALTGKTVNIPDVYEAEGFDFTGPRNYDASTGYRSQIDVGCGPAKPRK